MTIYIPSKEFASVEEIPELARGTKLRRWGPRPRFIYNESRKLPYLFVVLALLFLLSACNSTEPAKSDTTEELTTTAKTNGDTEKLVAAANVGPWDLPAPPPRSEYSGPLFQMSHDYPNYVPPDNPKPWQTAINNGQITTENAPVYMQALKDFVAKDMQTLLYDYENWQANSGWYNQPWLSQIRDPIRGTYVGSGFPAAMFPQSGLSASMTTHVAVYYDSVAATSLSKVWGSTGMDPVPGLEQGGAQFPEGGIIVKPAFTTADESIWPPMAGAYPAEVYIPEDCSQQSCPNHLTDVQLFQFDIIVKDSQSSPETGWVFTTLVFDNRVNGDYWQQMIPLGVMWGNDPDVISPESCNYLIEGDCPPLNETWINPDAPLYAKETLGWGGRLSGPNDGAVDIDAVVMDENGDLTQIAPNRYAMSSCMGCHGAAEYTMQSFLLPSPANCKNDSCTPTFAKCEAGANPECHIVDPGPYELVYHESGSPEFMRWFQNRPGDVPQDEGAIALDYGMNYAFKALPSWYKNTDQTADNTALNFVDVLNNYRGLHPKYDDT